MIRRIWLDDNRPATAEYTNVCRNYTEFRTLIERIIDVGDTLDFVNFDYHLGDFPDPNWPFPHEKNGKDCARYLIGMYRKNTALLDRNFIYGVHSSDRAYNVELVEVLEKLMAMIDAQS